MGDGLVDGMGVRLPPEGDEILRCFIMSMRERFEPPLLVSSSGPGLSARLSGCVWLGGEVWFEETELRCEGTGRGEGSLRRPLCEEIVGECEGPSPPDPELSTVRKLELVASPISASATATPSS